MNHKNPTKQQEATGKIDEQMNESSGSAKRMRDSLAKKNTDVDSTYKIDTSQIQGSDTGIFETVKEKIEDIKNRSSHRSRKKKDMKDLGLHEDFDPLRTYDVKSRQVGIKTWKDFMIVYVFMAFTIFCFVALLVYMGYFDNPLEEYLPKKKAIPSKESNVIDEKNDDQREAHPRDQVEDRNNYVLILSPKEGDVVDGMIYVEGESSSKYSDLSIVIYDEQKNVIGQERISLEGQTGSYAEWLVNVNIVNSPITTDGTIEVTASSTDSDQVAREEVKIGFSRVAVFGIIDLYGPINGQLISENGSVRIVGVSEMSGTKSVLFEILDEQDSVVTKGAIPVIGGMFDTVVTIPVSERSGVFGKVRVGGEEGMVVEARIRFL